MEYRTFTQAELADILDDTEKEANLRRYQKKVFYAIKIEDWAQIVREGLLAISQKELESFGNHVGNDPIHPWTIPLVWDCDDAAFNLKARAEFCFNGISIVEVHGRVSWFQNIYGSIYHAFNIMVDFYGKRWIMEPSPSLRWWPFENTPVDKYFVRY